MQVGQASRDANANFFRGGRGLQRYILVRATNDDVFVEDALGCEEFREATLGLLEDGLPQPCSAAVNY